ncbi:MAG: DUF393 domain-containing protein [Merismopedia sp. SIO2A8]|nr:DUF393 domain-containing protein [Merismopedia sp. SIO2A8]
MFEATTSPNHVPTSPSGVQGSNYPSDQVVGYGDRPIIFFDGECVLCNGFVDWLLQIDRGGIFALAPLQGETARACLPPLPHNPAEWSIYYQDASGLYSQSDAVLQICRRLGGGWELLSLGTFMPRMIRDRLYRLVADHRYNLLGRRSTCRMPSPSEKERFLP